MHPLRHLSLGILLTCAPALAAKTWIVDAGKGPGWQFTDIPAAVAAAAPGDAIVVRAGKYGLRRIDKGVRILGEPGAEIVYPLLSSPLSITEIPRNQTLVLRGVRLSGTYTHNGLISIWNCEGVVALQDITTQTTLIQTHGIRVSSCRAVFVERCEVIAGLSASKSAVTIAGGSFDRNPSAAAIQLDDSTATIAGARAKGTDGIFVVQPQPGLVARSSRVRLQRDSVVQAGRMASGPQVPVSAAIGNAASSLLLDPDAMLIPNGNAPKHTDFGRVSTRRLPALAASGGAIGQNLAVELRSEKGDFFGVIFGPPAAPLALPFGDLWLDLRVLFVLVAGVQPDSGRTQLQFRVPNEPSLRGLTLGWQGQSGVLPNLVYTNAAVTVIR